MPQKRNPVACAVALAASVRVPPLVATMLSAMVQEHERGLGGWHAEWETLPEIFLLTGGALAQLAHALASPELDVARMSANLGASRGLILAEAAVTRLSALVGREAARGIVETASRRALHEDRGLRDVLAESLEVRAHLSATDLDALFDPVHYLGEANALIDRALAAHEALRLE
jgi:3-carboxy-cis,cis-muconate cycloisomerase